jgi:hypothetical protein
MTLHISIYQKCITGQLKISLCLVLSKRCHEWWFHKGRHILFPNDSVNQTILDSFVRLQILNALTVIHDDTQRFPRRLRNELTRGPTIVCHLSCPMAISDACPCACDLENFVVVFPLFYCFIFTSLICLFLRATWPIHNSWKSPNSYTQIGQIWLLYPIELRKISSLSVLYDMVEVSVALKGIWLPASSYSTGFSTMV